MIKITGVSFSQLAQPHLILSGEIAAKQAQRDLFQDGHNVLLVPDPKQNEVLAAKLRQAIEDPAKSRKIGVAGAQLVLNPDGHDRFIESWENLIFRAAGRTSNALSLAEKTSRDIEGNGGLIVPKDLHSSLGWTSRLLGGHFAAELDLFNRERPAGTSFKAPLEIDHAFVDHLFRRYEQSELEVDAESAEACFQFERERRASRLDDDNSANAVAFAAPDQLLDAPFQRAAEQSLKPLRSTNAKVVHFRCNPLPWFQATATGQETAVLCKEETLVLFHRTPNLMPCELKVSPQTTRLLELCDGTATTEQLLTAMVEDHAAGGSASDLRPAVLAALKSLYEHRIIIFRT